MPTPTGKLDRSDTDGFYSRARLDFADALRAARSIARDYGTDSLEASLAYSRVAAYGTALSIATRASGARRRYRSAVKAAGGSLRLPRS